MTDRTIKRGNRVLVWATVTAPTNNGEPSGLWWVRLDERVGNIAIHQDAMVIPDGECADKEAK